MLSQARRGIASDLSSTSTKQETKESETEGTLVENVSATPNFSCFHGGASRTRKHMGKREKAWMNGCETVASRGLFEALV